MSDDSLIIGARPEVRGVKLDEMDFVILVRRGQCEAPSPNHPQFPLQVAQQLAKHDVMLMHLIRDYDACRARVAELEAVVDKLTTELTAKLQTLLERTERKEDGFLAHMLDNP